MTHFGIFGHDFNTGGLIESAEAGTATNTGQTITGGSFVESGQSSTFIESISLDFLPKLNELLNFNTQTQIHSNLTGLGEASIDISNALNENIAIRETQRASTNQSLQNIVDYVNSVNERLSGQVVALGESQGGGAGGEIGGILDKLGGIIGISGLTAGIIIGGIIIFKVIK